MLFKNRIDAGRLLAERLGRYRRDPDAIVLGIPRGGVVVAAEVARALDLPLDVSIAAKIGAPGNPEYAVGAVTPDGDVVVNATAGFTSGEVAAMANAAREKAQRYEGLLRQDRPPLELEGKTVLLVDDGLATGLTARAAVKSLKKTPVRNVVVAVPVASEEAVESLKAIADDVVAVSIPSGFAAVGQFYESFSQTEDAEVLELLGEVSEGVRR